MTGTASTGDRGGGATSPPSSPAPAAAARVTSIVVTGTDAGKINH